MRVQNGLDFKNLPVALDSGQRGSSFLVGRIASEHAIAVWKPLATAKSSAMPPSKMRDRR